ncbi:MAG: uracil-DNA glycosylase [Cryomorphaceae bacterium]|nr:uracil-DNA glycosylase [Cryomorphaceae bacterium]
MPKSWAIALKKEFKKPYFQKLNHFVESEYAEKECYPPKSKIFAAFEHCTFEDVRVVILGQDPYHGAGQANGLSFSVADGVPIPPSLKNIFREIQNDLGILTYPSGNLERWAKQGVLLLNATLTVQKGLAGSHQKMGWETFTNAVIQKINSEKKGVVFLLWGGFASKKSKLIDEKKHIVLVSGHPSPLSANRGHWFGNKHFSRVNIMLETPIDWS